MSAFVCNACGNKTRFDVFESKRVRSFHHYTLGGDLTIEEEEVLQLSVDKIVCRWCQSTDISEVPTVPAAED
jgi:hypothetical protein